MGEVKIFFGIHKHMHQPYYDAANLNHWDGQKDEIFASRSGPYTFFIPAAVRQYISGNLPHSGMSTSWSGSLIKQLDRCAKEGLCGGIFNQWSKELRKLATEKTVLGHPRVDFAGFGYFHPLMALIPGRDIVRQIEWHKKVISETFGVEASSVLFPPETAFHVRMIPALKKAGINAVIYDSIHRYRSCKNYPYAGGSEGMPAPNKSEQTNPEVTDWLQLQNIWAGSKISPSLLKPEYVGYEDPDGTIHKVIAVPAERYIGNEDARGGFGALQYPNIFEQLRNQLSKTNAFDPSHPPFFLLHSDGDNHGGGADSYYQHNTGSMVEWLKETPWVELTTVKDYLDRFPPDPEKIVHIEPGSWSGADSGDPQFMKWFSRYTDAYSPDLNSWSVLTAFQNVVHSMEDISPDHPALSELIQLLLTAETSCYWYWTGQEVWDRQVTNAVNKGLELCKNELASVKSKDKTGPTVFAPWVTNDGTVHTFVSDMAGLTSVKLVIRSNGKESVFDMKDNGEYPCQTGAKLRSNHFTLPLEKGLADLRYFIEAIDHKGNKSRSSLERIFV